MKSDQELKFHPGQEFTKKDDSRVHCIVQSYIDGEFAYLVSYTKSGHTKKVSEADLVQFYSPSTPTEKHSALDHLNETSGSHDNNRNENGTHLSPASDSVKG
jgi:hypothetical protein